MKMVKLTENCFVNPEQISIIEIIPSSNQLVCTVGNRQIVCTVDPQDLMSELIKCGLEANMQLWVG